MSHKSLTSLILMFMVAACTPAAPGAIPTSSPAALTTTPGFTPTVTPIPPTTTSIPEIVTTVPVASPASAWKDGWVDFNNNYYRYAISIPVAAKVTKNEEISSYNLDDVPADWNPEEDFSDYLNLTYPPGLCVTIEYGPAVINIAASDFLGGKYGFDCRSFGGLGEGNWIWTEEVVAVGESPSIATVVRRCDAQNQNCGPGTYGLQSSDGTNFVLFNVDDSNQELLFEVLRSYRPAPKTELYCPNPAPTRLMQGEYAFVSTDPPLAHNNVRTAPGINQELIGKIVPGEAFELLEGPICNNSLQWWKVRLPKTGLVGWTPEGNHDTYWLQPCESKESCGIPYHSIVKEMISSY